MFGYNVQAAVDDRSQIVVACDLHDSATDYGALPSLVDQVKLNCDAHAQSYLADAGYHSLANVKKIASVGSTSVISDKASKRGQEAFSEQISKGGHDREYFCRAGRRLPLASRNRSGTLSFKLGKDFCKACENPCQAHGKKHPEVLDDDDRQRFNANLAWSRTKAWKAIYKRRQAIVEPVFGNIKNKGMKIYVRGRKAVSVWWNMATTAHNIEKIIQNMG